MDTIGFDIEYNKEINEYKSIAKNLIETLKYLKNFKMN